MSRQVVDSELVLWTRQQTLPLEQSSGPSHFIFTMARRVTPVPQTSVETHWVDPAVQFPVVDEGSQSLQHAPGLVAHVFALTPAPQATSGCLQPPNPSQIRPSVDSDGLAQLVRAGANAWLHACAQLPKPEHSPWVVVRV